MPESWPNLRPDADVKKKLKGPRFDDLGRQITPGEINDLKKRRESDPQNWRERP